MTKLIKQTKLIIDFSCDYIEWIVGERVCYVVNKTGLPPKLKSILSDKFGDRLIVDILHEELAKELIK